MCLCLHDVNSFDLQMKLGKGPPLRCKLFSVRGKQLEQRGAGGTPAPHVSRCSESVRGWGGMGPDPHALPPACPSPPWLPGSPSTCSHRAGGRAPAGAAPAQRPSSQAGSQEQLMKHPSRSVSRFHTEGARELQLHHCLLS